MKIPKRALACVRIGAALSTLLLTPSTIMASSHMDAPLITRDPSAHITDVYAFVSKIGNVKYLTAALAVYPFEEPSIGPNKYNFDDNVVYALPYAAGKSFRVTQGYHGSFSHTGPDEFAIDWKMPDNLAIRGNFLPG